MSTPFRRPGRSLSGLAVLGAVSLLLSACGSSGGAASSSSSSGAAASKLPKTLVFSPLSLAPPALKGLSVGVKGYAGSKGWDVIVQDPNFDPTKQAQQLSEVLDSGRAGAAWVIAVAPKSMGDTLKAAQSKSIPILVNGKPDEWGYSGAQPGITFDYIDYAAGGQALGDQLGKCITQKLGGNGQVLFAQSTPGQAGKAEFEAAAVAALKAAAPNAKIVQTLVVKDRASGQTDIGNALQGHPDLNAVMASTDEGTPVRLVCSPPREQAAVRDRLRRQRGGAQVGQGGHDLRLRRPAVRGRHDPVVRHAREMQADPKAAGLVLTVPQKIVTQTARATRRRPMRACRGPSAAWRCFSKRVWRDNASVLIAQISLRASRSLLKLPIKLATCSCVAFGT